MGRFGRGRMEQSDRGDSSAVVHGRCPAAASWSVVWGLLIFGSPVWIRFELLRHKSPVARTGTSALRLLPQPCSQRTLHSERLRAPRRRRRLPHVLPEHRRSLQGRRRRRRKPRRRNHQCRLETPPLQPRRWRSRRAFHFSLPAGTRPFEPTRCPKTWSESGRLR